jgi:hypothetical protein
VDAVVGARDDVGRDLVPNRGAGACSWSRRQVQHGAKHEVAQVKLSRRKVLNAGVGARGDVDAIDVNELAAQVVDEDCRCR